MRKIYTCGKCGEVFNKKYVQHRSKSLYNCPSCNFAGTGWQGSEGWASINWYDEKKPSAGDANHNLVRALF